MDQTGGVNPSTPMPQGAATNASSGSADSAAGQEQAVELVISHGDAVAQPQQQPVTTPTAATPTIAEPVISQPLPQQAVTPVESQSVPPPPPASEPVQEVQPSHERVIQPLPAPLQPPPVTEPVLPPEISINKSDVLQPTAVGRRTNARLRRSPT